MMKYFYGAVLCLFLGACGSSGSGSDNVNQEEIPESSSDSLDSLQNVEDDDPVDSIPDSYIKDVAVDFELIQEEGSSFRDNFEAVQVGRYRWMTSNVSKNEMVTTNMCYGDSASNCDLYGRLFKYVYAGDACPNSYHVPTKEDWFNLMSLRLKYPDLDTMLNLSYGGFCSNVFGSTTCSGIDTDAYYLTADSLVAHVKKGSKGVSFSKFSMNDYYSLRCVGYVDIVENLKDLPTCNESSAQWLDRFYVVKKKSNYYCTGSRWVDDFTDDCDKSQKNVYVTFNDSAYVCKNGYWQLASINDSRTPCTEDIDSSLIVFNGIHYACEDRLWRKFSEVEDSLGYCSGKRFFKLDSLVKGDSYAVYVCDALGWRSAKKFDYLGYCGEEQYRKIDTLKMEKDTSVYFCDSTGWRLAENTDYLRECNAKNYGKVASLKLENDTLVYACDSSGWRYAVIEDVYGVCDSAGTYKIASFGGRNYVCRDSDWDDFTSLENALGICTPKRQGVIDTVPDGYDYICDLENWRRTKKDDYLGTCTAKRDGEMRRYDGYGYICRDSVWRQLSKLESELGLCESSNLGKLKLTDTGIDYICTESGWKTASLSEVMGECNAKNEGKLGTYGGIKYYCNGAKWLLEGGLTELGQCLISRMGTLKKLDGISYVCDSSGWRSPRSRETVIGTCTAKNQDSVKVKNDSAFVCKNGYWSMVSVSEYLGACTSSNEGEVKSYAKKDFVCSDTRTWRELNEFESRNGVCAPSVYGTIIQEDSRYYYCYGAKWKQVSTAFGKMGSCSLTDTSTYIRPDSVYFCSKGNWIYLSPANYLGECNSATPQQKLYGSIVYYCDTTASANWFKLTAKDSVQGYCRTSLLGKSMTYKDSLFICTGKWNPKSWTPATEKEFLTVCDENRDGETFFNGFNKSKCVNGEIQCLDQKMMTDSRDGQVYKYVELKSGEVWMSEDMRYNGVDSAWCMGELNVPCESGMHYTYAASRKACPAGWHIPSKDEFMYLHQIMRDVSSVYNNGDYSYVYGLSMLSNAFIQFYRMNGIEPRARYIDHKVKSYWTSADTMEYYSFTDRLYYTFEEEPIGNYVPQETSFKILGLSVRCKKD
ncbi:FISUMP domain-containing protein [uncultured Fibrobacter sp.]|uniref:FISUMP domain-containing protein n=1 Tax=uncultured Fibrobacter sp. TaxID=261512 RepID=UPI00262F2017|nr:FISUMP domain-containing protein [uncultured Fibrobacter sp.]